jgi:hypothetical protein
MKLKIVIDGQEIFTDKPEEVTDIIKKIHPGRPIFFDPTLSEHDTFWSIYEGTWADRTIGHIIRVR